MIIIMVGAVSAIIAVLGTLLGSALTYAFQRKTAERSETFAFQQHLRTEQTSAYTAFVVAVTEFRRGQHDRWHRQNEAPGSSVALDARVESYRLDGVALHALSQVQLVAADPTLVDTAEQAYELTSALSKASTEDDLDASTKPAKAKLQKFIELASRDVQTVPRRNVT